MRKLAWAIAALVVLALVPAAGWSAPAGSGSTGTDIREVAEGRLDKLALSGQALRQARRMAASVPQSAGPAAIGDEKLFLAYDDVEGILYVKNFVLRGEGDHVEVWVADDADEISVGTEFPEGDCRNDGVRNMITDEQVQYLVGEFDDTMYPIESEAFSVPPERDGTEAPLAELLELPPDYWAGEGDNIVVLVDNVRDENFYDTDNANGFTYVAGFYSSAFDFYVNRLVMNIDAFDWLHRTGPNPPNEPSTDLCTNAPARPYLYEGVFAHEYQHLLENYVDWDEGNWINEGLSDYAQTITGYVDPSKPIDDQGFDSHVQCFLGWLAVQTPANTIPRNGGAENSLTLWGDQADYESEVLCDYGAAYTFMEYLADQFGERFMTRLHLSQKGGLHSLQTLLNRKADGLKALTVIKRWATMVAVDKALDQGYELVGGNRANFMTETLNADINWANDQSYAGPGVPANGSDYVRLQSASGSGLKVSQVDRIAFEGAAELPSLPIEWTVDAAPPDGTSEALYSGMGDNIDRSIVTEVAVGAGVLSMLAKWDTELDYDYAYVQVSTDGGETYESVSCTDSVPGPLGPSFNGDSDGFVTQTCDLSAYSDETVLLALRYVADASVTLPGFWVDDVDVDGTALTDGTTLEGWSSPTEINPVEVFGYSVRLVAFDKGHKVVRIASLPLGDDFEGSLVGADVRQLLGRAGGTVAAIVTYLDPTEGVIQTAPYTLLVNGVEQPGG
ncbi:MAG TPA: peptidase M6 [Actinomycetota bacterium]|nr:peptidase M6 [Actinomycetota bacterium]